MNTIRSFAHRFTGLAAIAAAALLAGCVAPAATTVHYEQAVGGAGVYQETHYYGTPVYQEPYYGAPVYPQPYYGLAYPPAVVVPAPVMVRPPAVVVRPAPVIVERPYARPPAPAAHYRSNDYRSNDHRRPPPPARAQAEHRSPPVAKPHAEQPRQAAGPRSGSGMRQGQGGQQGSAPPSAGDTRRDSGENSGP